MERRRGRYSQVFFFFFFCMGVVCCCGTMEGGFPFVKKDNVVWTLCFVDMGLCLLLVEGIVVV